MAGFSADWLALREPADHAARSVAITRAVFDSLPHARALRILDLAAGTGSNLRYLAAARQSSRRADGPSAAHAGTSWLLVDHDPTLLARVPEAADVATRCVDLSTLDDGRIFEGRSLVTASALLDLVSEGWLHALAARCADAGAVVLFALSYDGRMVCTPAEPEDRSIVALVNEHQRTDKGFGPALGPDATDAAVRCFESAGYSVQRARSDWVLPPASDELQRQLIDGWAAAAKQIASWRSVAVDAWRDRRIAHVDAGRSEIIVGHEDLMGVLGARNLRI